MRGFIDQPQIFINGQCAPGVAAFLELPFNAPESFQNVSIDHIIIKFMDLAIDISMSIVATVCPYPQTHNRKTAISKKDPYSRSRHRMNNKTPLQYERWDFIFI